MCPVHAKVYKKTKALEFIVREIEYKAECYCLMVGIDVTTSAVPCTIMVLLLKKRRVGSNPRFIA